MAARVATDEAETTSGPEEEAAWAKARQTREEVSKLIGQYLLKGYRMLDASCTDCGVSPCVQSVLRLHTHYYGGTSVNIDVPLCLLTLQELVLCFFAHADMITRARAAMPPRRAAPQTSF